MNIQKFLGFVAFLLIAFNLFVETEAYQSPAFQTGIRFGRSGGVKKLSARRTMVAPRNERFELGSRYARDNNQYPKKTHNTYFPGFRYGKRSNLDGITETLIYPIASSTMPMKTFLCGKDDAVMCTYTGISNLYRCNQSFDDEPKDDPQRELKE